MSDPKNKAAASKYMEKKIAGICVRKGCKLACLDDSVMCEYHRDLYVVRRFSSRRRLRKSRRAQNLCTRCGSRFPPGLRRGCLICKFRRGRARRYGQHHLQHHHGAEWRADAEGFARYRGKGRRGAPTAIQDYDTDLGQASKMLENGRNGLHLALSAEVKAMPRIQRKAVLDEARALLELAARFIDEVTLKLRGDKVEDSRDERIG